MVSPLLCKTTEAKITTPYTTTLLGKEAELHALYFLQQQGLSLITQNYRAKTGEIDLIMQDQEHTVFVEVKFRQSETYGDAMALVSLSKQRRIIQTATRYLLEQNSFNTTFARFDIVAIFAQPKEISWIKNAFEVNYR